jgi:uncharacterized coiled-coil protein SlyX
LVVGSLSPEKSMEARIARLESDVAHLRSDAAEIKTGVHGLRERMDTRMDRLESKFDAKFPLALSVGIASVAGILGAMARGFGWL